MKKLIYLTSNPGKVEEANRHFRDRYGFTIEIKNPDFKVLEIQSDSCIEVAKFSAKYGADKLNTAVLKSDTGVYIDYLGGLPGPYNAYFDKQIGVEKFLQMMAHVTNPEDRKCRLEHVFAYCEPGKDPIHFAGGSTGTVAMQSQGTRGRWHDLWFIPDGETKTLSQLREEDEMNEAKFWGTAIDDFAAWFQKQA